MYFFYTISNSVFFLDVLYIITIGFASIQKEEKFVL